MANGKKIKVTNISTSHRYGVVANEDIRCSETLVEIPRNIALTPNQSSIASRLRDFKEENMETLQQTSGWISLLLALMYEMKKGDSYWAPYLALCPSINEFNQPMFWRDEERQEELTGMSLLWDVQRDLYNIEKEYQQFAVPFIEGNQTIMNKESHDLNLYKHMVGFVMSYSFTDYETGETLMVPVADLFNHNTNNNAQLSFDDESLLRMISTKPIKKGEEIFNTFGKLGNSHLLHMYGFVENHPNPNDTVEISLTQIVDALEATDANKMPVFQAMLAFMRKMGIASEKDQFIFGLSGLKSGPDLYAVLRILHMDFKEFTGLLQDHVSWYQDTYFLYLLEHVHQATSKEQNGEEDPAQPQNCDSDEDITIVKEVRVSARESKEKSVAEEGLTKAQNNGSFKSGEQQMKIEENQKVEGELQNEERLQSTENKTKKQNADKVKEKPAEPVGQVDSKSACRKVEATSEAATEGSKSELSKKCSPTSDGSRKSKTRKRKPAKYVHDSDDSAEELNYKAVKKQYQNTKPITEINRVNKNDINADESVSKTVDMSKEDTANWILKLPHVDDEHSEDPDDGSDYGEDSETQLQLTYDQISSILPTSWKTTMQSVITSALAQMKQDPGKTKASNLSEHAILAYQVRLGQKKILQMIKKSLAT
eukprot:gene15478-6729_t